MVEFTFGTCNSSLVRPKWLVVRAVNTDRSKLVHALDVGDVYLADQDRACVPKDS